MTSTAKFKTTARAALAALVISSAAVTAMPAQAAGQGSFGIGFNTGNGVSFFFNGGQPNHNAHKVHQQGKKQNFRQVCMTNREIRQDLRQYGFRNIHFNKKNGKRVRVTAVRGLWKYKLRVNRCNGNVATLDRDRIGKWFPHKQTGLNFQFNFR